MAVCSSSSSQLQPYQIKNVIIIFSLIFIKKTNKKWNVFIYYFYGKRICWVLINIFSKMKRSPLDKKKSFGTWLTIFQLVLSGLPFIKRFFFKPGYRKIHLPHNYVIFKLEVYELRFGFCRRLFAIKS